MFQSRQRLDGFNEEEVEERKIVMKKSKSFLIEGRIATKLGGVSVPNADRYDEPSLSYFRCRLFDLDVS